VCVGCVCVGPCVWAIVPAHVNNYDYCSLWGEQGIEGNPKA
jgi:hypothetical protein